MPFQTRRAAADGILIAACNECIPQRSIDAISAVRSLTPAAPGLRMSRAEIYLCNSTETRRAACDWLADSSYSTFAGRPSRSLHGCSSPSG